MLNDHSGQGGGGCVVILCFQIHVESLKKDIYCFSKMLGHFRAWSLQTHQSLYYFVQDLCEDYGWSDEAGSPQVDLSRVGCFCQRS